MRPKNIGMVGFDGVAGSHLTLLADTLGAAFLDDGFGGRIACYKTWLIGLTNKTFLTESGLALTPQTTLAEAPALDTIVIAGGRGLDRAGVKERLVEWLLSRSLDTPRMASLGSGLEVLAASGLLAGRKVTTHWRASRRLQLSHPSLEIDHRRMLMKDGPFHTGAGLTAGAELALAFIQEDYGQPLALSVRRGLMLYLGTEKPMPIAERTMVPQNHSLDRLGELVAWIMRNLDKELTVEVLARQACMCPSHFTRAFKSVFGGTPVEFVENLRLNEARRRLSSKGKTVRCVAESVGFASGTAFRRAFQRRFGQPPLVNEVATVKA